VYVLFFQTMLSTVIQRLHQIRTEAASDRRLPTIDLCAAAFPDVRPWQVQKECVLLVEAESKELKAELGQFYYTYLSLLLHPLDGHKAARLDPNLVKVRCLSQLNGRLDDTSDVSHSLTNRFLSRSGVSSRQPVRMAKRKIAGRISFVWLRGHRVIICVIVVTS